MSARYVTAVGLAMAATIPMIPACSNSPTDPGLPDTARVVEFDFAADTVGWRAGFADYPVGREGDVMFVADYRALPDPLGPDSAFYQYGVNISDDLFMYFARPIDGLRAGTRYRITFELSFASNYGQDCTIGVGASIYVKAGASTAELQTMPDSTGVERLNVEKGGQQQGGANALLLGDARNGEPGCGAGVPYAVADLESRGASIEVAADGAGRMWIFMGTESAFESPHELYFTRLRVVLQPLDPATPVPKSANLAPS